jgi:hypothetical protein
MRILKIGIIILSVTILALTNLYAQTNNSVELKKIASSLIECFYVVKTQCSIVLSGECATVINQRISNMALALQTKIDNNKAGLIQKLGKSNFEELENQANGYLELSQKMETELTRDDRAKMAIWLSFSKSKVEELFIKLNK